jgi:hypothetical protein
MSKIINESYYYILCLNYLKDLLQSLCLKESYKHVFCIFITINVKLNYLQNKLLLLLVVVLYIHQLKYD